MVSSGGVLPVSVAIPDDLVYVANSGNGGSNYAGFRLGPDGRLEPIAGSAVALPDGSQPGDVLFNGEWHQARRDARSAPRSSTASQSATTGA